MPGMTRATLRIAWRLFQLHWRVFLLSELILFGSWVSLELAVAMLHRLGGALNIVLHLAFLLLFSGLMVGTHDMALLVVDGRAPTLESLTRHLARGPSYLLAIYLYSAAVAGGLLLFAVPGVYLAVRYALFGHVLAAHGGSALDALRDAASLSRGSFWELFGFLLVVTALNIAGAAVLGLGLLITFPVTLLAISSVFRTLQHRNRPLSSTPDKPRHSTRGGLGGGGAPPWTLERAT